MQKLLRILLITAALCRVAQGEEPSGIAVTADGERFSARLLSIDSDWNLGFAVGDSRRTVGAADLTRWGELRGARRGPLLLLRDGSVLACDLRRFTGDKLQVDCPLWGAPAIARESCRGVVFHPPAGALRRDLLLRRVEENTAGGDWLLLDNGDVVSGDLVASAADADGGLDRLVVEARGDIIRAPLENVAALAFRPPAPASRSTHRLCAWLGFRDGSRLLAQSIETKNDKVTATLVGGARLQTETAALLDELTLVQPLGGRVDYLSDLPEFGYKHAPFLDLSWPYRLDRNVLGGRLRHNDQARLKGIGMHSASRLAYDLGGRYRRFQAELAIDDAAGQRGSVVFRVYVGAESGELRPAVASRIVRGGAAPLSVSIDVSGAARLVLLVDYADHGDQLDYANWLDARLVKR